MAVSTITYKLKGNLFGQLGTNSVGQDPLIYFFFFFFKELELKGHISISFIFVKPVKAQSMKTHIAHSAPHNTLGSGSYFLWAKPWNRRPGVENGFHKGQRVGSLRCMWVAWAQHPNLPLRPKGESVIPGLCSCCRRAL